MAFTVFDPNASPLTTLVQALLAASSGISVIDSSISLRRSGAGAVNLYDSSVGTPLGIGAGVLLTSGITPGTSNTSTWYGADNSGTSGFANGDSDIDAVVNTVFQTQSFDATTLKFDFTVTDPAATSISFDLVFGSDEYPEWVDAFVDCGVVIVDGVNYALFNNDPLHPLSVVSPNLTAGYFKDNGANTIPIEYDGVSGRLRIVAPLMAAQSIHTIKIGIADTGDHILDSGLFIADMTAGTTPGSGVVSNPGGGTSGNDNCSGSSKDEFFDLQAGNDTVYAGGGADIIVAGSGNDMVYAGTGNDDLKGDGGDDWLDGGTDLDTAVYAGLSTAYGLSYDALSGTYSINGTSQGEGIDTLVGIEQLKFGDGLFSLSSNGTTGVLTSVLQPPPPPVNTAGGVVLSGLAAVGATLSATVIDADGVPSTEGAVSWQWYSDLGAITGATSSTYRVKTADSNHSLWVQASYTDAKGTGEGPSSASVFVQPLPIDGELTATLMTVEGPASASVNTTITTLLVRAVELGETPNGAILKISSALKVPAGVTSLLTTNAFKTLQSGAGNTTTALALAKLEVQVAVLCSVSDDASGLKLTLALLNKAAAGGSYDLSNATDLAAILDLNTSAINFADKTTWPKTLQEIFDRNNNIKDAGKLLTGSTASGQSIESEWMDFLSNWDSLADNVPLTSLSQAINQGPSGFATAKLPELLATDAGSFVLTTAQLTQGFQDPDGDLLSVVGLTTDQGAWFIDNGAGSWSINSNYDPTYVGPLELSYEVNDGQGQSLAASQLVLVVAPPSNHAPTGSVTIGGSASQGQTLTATNSLADADGIPSSGQGAIVYTWIADGASIATGDTLLLTQAQVGQSITVTASYIDGVGTAESVSSAGTAAVANVNDAPTGSVTISGTATEGQILTAANALADLDGIPVSGTGAITYQWNANGTAIVGGTASTYLLTAADVGKTITVTAAYIDGFGTAESVTSLPTTAVLAGDTTPPALSSIGLSGSTVVLTFSEALGAAGMPAPSAFVVQTVNGSTVSNRTVRAVAIDTSDPSGRRVLLTLGGTAPPSTVNLRVSYTDPSGNQATGVLQDQAGNDVPGFTNQYATTFSSSLSVASLASNYSTLILTGTSAINGTGNASANIIIGNGAVNVITGGAGIDSMDGGSSGDIYIVANASDHAAAEIGDTGPGGAGSVDELRFSAITTAGGATLTVHAGDTGLERAIIGTGTGITASTTGTTALNINASEAPNSLEITGNSGANSLVGTAFADTINGLGGNDTLTGGAGADVFRFTTTPNATSNRDLITDFTTGSDVLSFKRASYAGFSSSATSLSSAQFLSGDGVTAATTIAQRFLYDTTSGILCYDRDGIGTTYSAIQVAVFGVSSHPALAYTDLALTA